MSRRKGIFGLCWIGAPFFYISIYFLIYLYAIPSAFNIHLSSEVTLKRAKRKAFYLPQISQLFNALLEYLFEGDIRIQIIKKKTDMG